MTDFSTWNRETLEALANDLMKDNLRMRTELKDLLEAIRKILKGIV